LKPVTVINHLVIKPGKMDEFIDAQRRYAAALNVSPAGIVGGRLYRGADDKSVVLVTQFESKSSQEAVSELDSLKQHINRLRTLVESSSPGVFEEDYTVGDFK
jgi:heme-degrading monooxygenase HmoA